MRSTQKLLIVFCAVFLCALAVGSGFSFFWFDKGETEVSDETVSIEVEEQVHLGSVTIVADKDYTYRLFGDVSEVTLLRSDDPSKAAEFVLRCDLTDVQIPDGFEAVLACDVIIADSDARGLTSALLPNSSNRYLCSASIADYFSPTAVRNELGAKFAFVQIDGDETSTTYRSILQTVTTAEGTATVETVPYTLLFVYNDRLTPSIQYESLDGYQAVMGAMREAWKHANVRVVFRLILQQTGG